MLTSSSFSLPLPRISDSFTSELVRKYMKSILKPGMLMADPCETLENTVRKLISENGLKAGIAFPTGCSLNWNQGLMWVYVMLVLPSKRSWNHTRLKLMERALAPTRFMLENLFPLLKEGSRDFAIETFASTGKGYVREDLECSHYMKKFDAGHMPLRLPRAKQLLATINKNFSTLAFCTRFMLYDEFDLRNCNIYRGRINFQCSRLPIFIKSERQQLSMMN
uniref:Peptidase M24 domain-containing protein n=1 Tax=Salix viminalis TaxID=40686 RepID=A0A6N2NAR3_SALVM